MNSSPKILVFKLRSLIYTLLLLFFGILLYRLPCPHVFPKAETRRTGPS